ncbi:MATE family efflux transporter [Gemmatimonadota bacterium]
MIDTETSQEEERREAHLSPSPSGEPSIGRVVVDAFRGRGGDPTEGPLDRAILYLAIPMVLEMAMESIFAVVDIFFVSRLGPGAMATVGLTESLMAIIYTLAAGLSIGVTATVARRTGERNLDAASRATGQAIVIGLVITVVLGSLGAWFAPSLLRLMGAEAAVVEEGVGYARILLGGNGAVLFLFLINAAFRGAGDAVIAMRVLWLGNALNMVLDPLLIFGLGPFPEWGISGAAAATVIGRGTAVALQLLVLFRLSDRLSLELRHLRPRMEVLVRLVRLSGTGTFQAFVSTASWIGLVRIIAGFGSEALAGYTVAIRIVLFALLPAWGLANAAATMVGQGLGAGKPDRAERAVWMAGKMNFVFLGSVGMLFLAFAPWMVSLFTAEPLTAAHGVHGLRIISLGFFFYGYGMVLTAAFNGAGDAWTPTWLNLGCFWAWEIPLAWFLAYRLEWGADGVFAAITVAFSTIAVAAGVLFKRGRWKKVKV